MGHPVHRDTDDRNCGAKTVVVNQSTVFANNLLVAVFGDPNTHGNGNLLASINPGNIFIENLELVVVDSDAEPDNAGHFNPKADEGSENVRAIA